MLTTPVAHSLCCTLPLNTCPNHTARTILLPHTTQHINMALLSKQNIMAKPAMRSAAMPRISPAIRRNVAAASAAPELLVSSHAKMAESLARSFLSRQLTKCSLRRWTLRQLFMSFLERHLSHSSHRTTQSLSTTIRSGKLVACLACQQLALA